MKVEAPLLLTQLQVALAGAPVRPVVVADDEDDSALPQELRSWLVRLRLLDGVPFAHLVADSALLPPESIRWFYLDRRWTDALVQGALSVGTVNSDDRTALTAQYPAVREELDAEERNVRRPAGSPRWDGPAAPISGFLLRSQAVSGWPALHVRAFSVDPAEADDAKFPDDDPRRMRLLRLERLAPAVLLCLFDGIPSVVHVEEPRQGVQFGFDVSSAGGELTAQLRPRRVSDFEHLPGAAVPVPFRSGGGAGVVDVQELERRLASRAGTGAGDGLDSGEYALQLVRLPWRQVYGQTRSHSLDAVFTPTVAYRDLAATFVRRPT